MYIIASRFWRAPGSTGFPELARKTIQDHISKGWRHSTGTMTTPHGEDFACGCPDCRPDGYVEENGGQ
jgi:hypothetical protein